MFGEEMEDPHKDMKAKLLDDLIEKIMSMDDQSPSEKPGLEISIEKDGDEPDSDDMSGEGALRDKLSTLKGI